VYLFTGGIGFAVSWWTAGIPYDLLHCAGNFVMALLLFVPLRKLLDKLYRKLQTA
jgi:energy-coupling factor transport system substrate-specific component